MEHPFYKNTEEFRVDCKNCFGLCCVALYFSSSEGFPQNKEAGNPCKNLKENFTCAVHKTLIAKGLKGCTAYDCFGAGQKLSQLTFKGISWRDLPDAALMFDSFLVMRQLQEMLWYLTEAFNIQEDKSAKEEIKRLIEATEKLTLLDAEALLGLNLEAHREKVNPILKAASEYVRAKAIKSVNLKNSERGKRFDYLGADLRKTKLIGADLRGTLLIAARLNGNTLNGADFIGSDMRDADIRDADLSRSIFLTQAQINSAKGNAHTKLPERILRPSHWEK
ncbi:pentapeptide repeat-containing protein [Clostridium sp. 19966]|uniref:pentapeptide repeat-containing protein n=1 Tax=Clostridium sp. 19966 TaxID=2768166 RepID=UPI0028DFF315|nr:pentapeptide repeat-containing protein [Clostridium sp. 19966]MDT8719417.1 pentapeptide repeat-containing protein [Clostridium sp. 19966]